MNLVRDNWRGYAAGLLVLVAATGVGFLLSPFLDPINIALIYLLGVVVCATTWGLGPSILCSVLGVVILDALFVPPYGILSVSARQDFLTFGVFLFVGAVISQLGARVRAEVQVARQREKESTALYTLNREIAFATNREWILDAALKQARMVFDAEPLVLLADGQGQLKPYGSTALDPKDLYRAQWALARQENGRTREPASAPPFLPLRTAHENFGIFGLRRRAGAPLNANEYRLLEAFANQIGLALKHLKLSEQAEQARLLEAGEGFRSALLSSLSHDLRTPLASIIGAVSSLLDETARFDGAGRTDLLVTVLEEATRLNRLVSNLLDMTRVEAGVLAPQRDWHSIDEVIDAALMHVDTRAHSVELAFAPQLPLVYFDFVLLEQVLVNLIENACKFSPPDSCIEIRAHCAAEGLTVSVLDRGVGIPAADLERVFEKFYRVPRRGDTPGSGLGLLICKGIIQAHGGKIWAERRSGGGTVVSFTLPLVEGGPIYE